MQIRIKETGEVKDLIIKDWRTGCEWTADLVQDDDCIAYNNEIEMYETDQKSFNWWENMIEEIEHAEDVKKEYCEKFGETAVEEALAGYDEPNDLEDQPRALIWKLENELGPLGS